MLFRSAILVLASLLTLAAAAPTNTSHTQTAGCIINTNTFCPVFEDDFYTNNRTNSYVKNGALYIQPTLTADNIGADKTAKSFSLQFGKVEIRAQLPAGDWLWPALWMLPTDAQYGMWPASGEIDIIESRGNAPTTGPVKGSDSIGSTLHWGPSYDGGTSFADDFHIFGLEWTPDGIKTTVDGATVLNVPFDKSFWDRGAFPAGVNNPWAGTGSCAIAAPFDQAFHIVMNVAVGGTGGYFPDSTPGKRGKYVAAWYPSWKGDKTAMKIDYVKAWKMC
ncbi:hypothetical protein HDU87_007936 [Geranomyces variabilis]|uniref:GH16 domain-containing protein n=1 Tax=Geranomyces variabilis TaxID=109894 RepID=A0AAD5XK24_9FUNG|nr:hypothetical protein HDU87_007936 [Geranomyces variabilis]